MPAKDPATRDRSLAHQLMDLRLNRLAAKQHGDAETMERLAKEIDKLQGERTTNWKKLHPGEAGQEAKSD